MKSLLELAEFWRTCPCCGRRFNVLLGHSPACADYFNYEAAPRERMAA